MHEIFTRKWFWIAAPIVGLMVLGMLVTFAQNVSAAPATTGGSGSAGDECFYTDITTVATFTLAGQTGMCTYYPDDVASNTAVVFVSASAMAPPAVGGTATTFTWALIAAPVGCTASALTSNTVSSGATAVANTYFTLTMTSEECRMVLEVNIMGGAVPATIANHRRAINIQVPFTNIDSQNRLCDASNRGTSCTNPELNNQNRLCDASTFGDACANPELNNQNRLCDASTFGDACANPEINVQSRSCTASTFTTPCVGTNFEQRIGMTSIEFFALVAIIFISILVWSRSTDYSVQYGMVAMLFIPAVIWIYIYLDNGLQLLLGLSILTFILAGYMGLRTALDLFEEQKNKKAQG